MIVMKKKRTVNITPFLLKGDTMKTNYENWVPKSMVRTPLIISTVLFLMAIPEFTIYISRRRMDLLFIPIVILIIAGISFSVYLKFNFMRKAFSFENENSIAWNIIHFVSDNVTVNNGAKILDVGCGSGALSIDCTKKYQNAHITGLDKWGASYKTFTKELCEANAKAEHVNNITFIQGTAVKLPFEDETFDAVTSNFVYHNIPGNRQNYILETLRVLKKGGSFALHDIFIKSKYGNLDTLLEKLKDAGVEKAEFVDTCNRNSIKKDEAKKTMLTGSKLLVGIK